MVRDGVHTCDIGNQIEVTFWNSLDNMDDPWSKVVSQGQLLGWLGEALNSDYQAAPQALASPARQPRAVVKITCAYCRSLYLLLPQTAAHPGYGCPNCGAPADAATASGCDSEQV